MALEMVVERRAMLLHDKNKPIVVVVTSTNLLKEYRPRFSFMGDVLHQSELTMATLRDISLRMEDTHSSSTTTTTTIQSTMMIPLSVLESRYKECLSTCNNLSLSHWSMEDLYKEYDCNIWLSKKAICTTTLLREVATHLQQYNDDYNNLLLLLYSVYSCAAYIAWTCIALKQESTTRVVERARMCISTFYTFHRLNKNRAIKAALVFGQCKLWKEYKNQHVDCVKEEETTK